MSAGCSGHHDEFVALDDTYKTTVKAGKDEETKNIHAGKEQRGRKAGWSREMSGRRGKNLYGHRLSYA